MLAIEDSLAVLNRVVEAMNGGDSAEFLANMAENVVIVDDVAPFYRSGLADAEQWLQGLSKSRNMLQASFSLQFAEVSEADDRAYIVAPGSWKGSLPDENLEVDGLATVTLVHREGAWLIDALVWGSMT
jgi:ketosteroid isomerase-like protein